MFPSTDHLNAVASCWRRDQIHMGIFQKSLLWIPTGVKERKGKLCEKYYIMPFKTAANKRASVVVLMKSKALHYGIQYIMAVVNVAMQIKQYFLQNLSRWSKSSRRIYVPWILTTASIQMFTRKKIVVLTIVIIIQLISLLVYEYNCF